MRTMARVFGDRAAATSARRSSGASASCRFVRRGKIERLPPPLSGWTAMRDLKPDAASETFREWWRRERGGGS